MALVIRFYALLGLLSSTDRETLRKSIKPALDKGSGPAGSKVRSRWAAHGVMVSEKATIDLASDFEWT